MLVLLCICHLLIIYVSRSCLISCMVLLPLSGCVMPACLTWNRCARLWDSS